MSRKVAEDETHVGLDQIHDVNGLSDEEMMEKMISPEFANWIKSF